MQNILPLLENVADAGGEKIVGVTKMPCFYLLFSNI